MPGIVGILAHGSSGEHGLQRSQMLNCLMHEPSYASGVYTNEQIGIWLGWVCHPGSFSDYMPVWNRARDVCLIFMGEDFPDNGTRSRLISREDQSGPLQSRYLLDLFETQEEQFLSRLNGWFHGVLVDLRKGEAVLFNDRYGMQRLYYYQSKEALYFSSEAKSLLRVCPDLRQLDYKSMGEVFSFGCVLENRTLFSKILLLPPGSAWTFRRGAVVTRNFYFKPDTWEGQTLLPKEEFYENLRERFIGLLPKYFESGCRIGLSLTGGLDTRMILASKSVMPGKLPCYTFGGMYRDCFDVKIARKIAGVCSQSHTVIEVGKSFFPVFPRLAEKTVYISDGNMDVSGEADIYVNKIAKEIAPVRLTGNYGSEILRGARHLKALPPCPGLYEAGFETSIKNASGTLADVSLGNRVTFAAFKQVPWHHHNRLAVEQSQLVLRSPYLDNELVGLMFRAPVEVLNSNEFSFRLVRDGSPQLASIKTDRGLGGDTNPVLSKISYLYHEFLFKADYAMNYGMPQWLAKLDHSVLAPIQLEKVFLGRHKFYHFRVWFRDELSGYVKEILLDPISLRRPYLNSKFTERMVLDHTSGKLNYTTEITKLLTAELMQRLLIDR